MKHQLTNASMQLDLVSIIESIAKVTYKLTFISITDNTNLLYLCK